MTVVITIIMDTVVLSSFARLLYNEGIKEGRKDRSRGERFEYRDEEDYRNANTDYNSRFGNRALYQQYFRQGFVNGYSDGYRGY